MKKYLFTILLFLGTIPIFCQTTDTTKSEELLDDEYREIQKNEDDSTFYQYRLSFSQVNSSYVAEDIKLNMRDLFKSDISFNEILNQFIFTTNRNLTQIEISKNLSVVVTYFKKIDLSRLSSIH